MNPNLSSAQFKSTASPTATKARTEDVDNYCPECEFDHPGDCEMYGRPAIRRGELL